jgi:hypothetical protein
VKTVRVKANSESSEQQAVITYCAFQSWRLPDVDKIFHIPNGGRRTMTEAKRFKAEGVKAGVPDLFLPVARGGYHGLFIEMKRPDHKNKPSKAQNEWQQFLTKQGYLSVVCYGYEEAIQTIQRYYGVADEDMTL